MTRSVLGILLIAFTGVLLGACASSDQPHDPNQVSSIPWNRPESWEGKGAMGGFAPGTQ
jgi:hypothetical protein